MQEEIEHLKKLSRMMRWACLLAIVMVIISGVYVANEAVSDRAGFTARFDSNLLTVNFISNWQIAGILLISAVPMVFAINGFYALANMFDRFGRGRYFDAIAIGYMRHAGGYLLASAVGSIVARTASVLLATINNLPGDRHLALGINANTLLMVLIAGVLYAIGHAFTIAAAIEAENRSFV